jgi:hypothetical protein
VTKRVVQKVRIELARHHLESVSYQASDPKLSPKAWFVLPFSSLLTQIGFDQNPVQKRQPMNFISLP